MNKQIYLNMLKALPKGDKEEGYFIDAYIDLRCQLKEMYPYCEYCDSMGDIVGEETCSKCESQGVT